MQRTTHRTQKLCASRGQKLEWSCGKEKQMTVQWQWTKTRFNAKLCCVEMLSHVCTLSGLSHNNVISMSVLNHQFYALTKIFFKKGFLRLKNKWFADVIPMIFKVCFSKICQWNKQSTHHSTLQLDTSYILAVMFTYRLCCGIIMAYRIHTYKSHSNHVARLSQLRFKSGKISPLDWNSDVISLS